MNIVRQLNSRPGDLRSYDLPIESQSRIARLQQLADELSQTPWSTWSRELAGIGTIIHTPVYSNGLTSTALKCPIEPNQGRLANFWHVSYQPSFFALPPLQYLRSGTPVHLGVRNDALRNAITEHNIAELHLSARSTQNSQRVLTIDLQSPDTEDAQLAIERVAVVEKATHLEKYPDTIALVVPTHERGINRSTNPQIITAQRSTVDKIVTSALEAEHLVSSAIRKTLAAEVREILKTEEFGQVSTVSRYALTARLVVLGWIGGMTPHVHCRSGKDRTGLVDVEVKFLYYQIACEMSGRSVSRLGEPRLPEEESVWRGILLNGGNHEIQEWNTGCRGSKLDHSSLRERIGAENWCEFIGDSHSADG